MNRLLVALLLTVLATQGRGQTLQFPSNAVMQIEDARDYDSYLLPVGIWTAGVLPTESVEGRLVQQAWRIDASGLTTLQLLRPLRQQLRDARYQILFECQTEACGGFDFRFAVKTLHPPEMQINIGDFRFLSARRMGQEGPEYVTLFVSRTARAGFVQVTQVSPEEVVSPLAEAGSAALRAGPPGQTEQLAVRLTDQGFAPLENLTFATGSARLGEGPFASVQALADFLLENPDLTVALVGHTDAAGSLEANISLSRQRAASVLERLVSVYGIPRRQLEAQGMGYLSPIANNLTEAGREANRRVEVIITSTAR